MRSKTAIILLFVIALLSISALGCKGEEKKPEPEKKPPVVIKIGAVLPLSGKSAAYGNWIKEAIELVKDETNSSGGINGSQIEIIYEDDKGEPGTAASAMQKLTEIDKVPVVYGSWVSSCVLAQAPIAEKTKTVLMAEAISPKIREAGDYVFRFDPDVRISLGKLMPFVLKQKHLKNATFYINNDFGVDQAEVFKKGIEEGGGKIVFQEGYDPNATDFRTALTKIKKLKPDAIFIPSYLEMATILKQIDELGIKSQIYSSFPFENDNIISIAGEAAEGVIYPFFFDSESSDEVMVKYQTDYQLKYGRPSEGFAALAYSGMTIIVDILKKVGPNPDQIKNELYKVKDYPSPFGPVSFDEKGDIDIPIYIKTVQNGKFVVLNK